MTRPVNAILGAAADGAALLGGDAEAQRVGHREQDCRLLVKAAALAVDRLAYKGRVSDRQPLPPHLVLRRVGAQV